jgi:uncharacterized damage-inducible protein DinB
MTTAIGITLEELLVWNDEAAQQWKSHFDANPAALELPCGINKSENVQALVRHIWGAEQRWAERLAGLPNQEVPEGPLDALYAVHSRAIELFGGLLDAPAENWAQAYELKFDWIPPEQRSPSRRKIALHALLHSQRHYAQLATLVRVAGYPSHSMGDLLFSAAVR